MEIKVLEKRFEAMGARVRFRYGSRWRDASPVRVDIGRDRRGELFEVRLLGETTPPLEVLDVRPKERHLLLMAREFEGQPKQKFLCGHDERSWFVAAIPEDSGASTVHTAMEALKPEAVQAAQERRGLKPKERARRRNGAYVRQGEWFFLPCPEMEFPAFLVLRHEALRRGAGKPHLAEELVRLGGETVYVCFHYPNGLTEVEYRKLLDEQPHVRHWNWRVMKRNMEVYVRGRITHSDHRTVVLPCWHRVEMNTETRARAMQSVAFLD